MECKPGMNMHHWKTESIHKTKADAFYVEKRCDCGGTERYLEVRTDNGKIVRVPVERVEGGF